MKFNVPPERIRPLSLNEPVTIEGFDPFSFENDVSSGAQVTFVDANHCPGAAMIVVEGLDGPPVIHTGDARLAPEAYQNDVFRRLKGKGCVLILDTTYCHPKYCFPPQKDVIQYVVDVVLSNEFPSDTLFLFGTYGIGKERLFFEIGKRAKKKIYVSAEKMKALECMNLSSEERALLTTDHEATSLHAVRFNRSPFLLENPFRWICGEFR